MRQFAKVSPRFWIGQTGRELRRLGPQAQVLGFYLFTNPYAHSLGLYYLPLPVVAHETGIPLPTVTTLLSVFSERGFAHYDHDTETIWVVEMAQWQVLGEEERLESTDNQVKGIHKELATLQTSPLYTGFYKRYRDAFHIPDALQPLPRGLPAPPQPLPSTETETETEIEKKISTNVLISVQQNFSAAPTTAWPVEDRWLRDFLHAQTLLPAPSDALDDPQWWERVSHDVNGLTLPFLEREFGKMGAWLLENKTRMPVKARGWKRFVRQWLERSADHERRQAFNGNKAWRST